MLIFVCGEALKASTVTCQSCFNFTNQANLTKYRGIFVLVSRVFYKITNAVG